MQKVPQEQRLTGMPPVLKARVSVFVVCSKVAAGMSARPHASLHSVMWVPACCMARKHDSRWSTICSGRHRFKVVCSHQATLPLMKCDTYCCWHTVYSNWVLMGTMLEGGKDNEVLIGLFCSIWARTCLTSIWRVICSQELTSSGVAACLSHMSMPLRQQGSLNSYVRRAGEVHV